MNLFKTSAVKLSHVAAALSLLAGTQVFAAPIVDQQNNAPLYVGYCTGSCEWQQTVTAGLTGQLTGIMLYGSGTGEVKIGLGSGFNSGPWAADILNAPIGGNQLIDLSAYNINLTAGQSFAIDTINITGGLSGTYTNPGLGALYLNMPQWGYNQFNYSAYGNYALGYTTFVDTAAAAVPEPGTLALFGLALFGLAATRRRKQ
jgi:hypothetical protein